MKFVVNYSRRLGRDQVQSPDAARSDIWRLGKLVGAVPSFFAIALYAVLTTASLAQMSGGQMFPGPGTAHSAGTYSGPGDVNPGAVAWWGFRAYSAAKAGNKAVRLVRASDSTQQDINTLANGSFDAASAATFCNATTCKVVTWYDQTGLNSCGGATACDVTQATDAQRPAYNATACGGLPCMTSLIANTTVMKSANGLTQTQPFSSSIVAARTASFTTTQSVLGDDAQVTFFQWQSSTTTWAEFANSSTVTFNNAACADNTLISLGGVMNGASSVLVCGSTLSGSLNPGTTDWGNGNRVIDIGAVGGSSPCSCSFAEMGIWPSAWNSTNYANAHTNQVSFWGVP